MTCIAYKNGVLACDSLFTINSLAASYDKKIKKFKNGILYGASGDNDDRELILLLENFLSGRPLTEINFPNRNDLLQLNCDLTSIVVIPPKFTINNFVEEIYVISTKMSDEGDFGVVKISHPYWAIGSGGELAIGAMAQGANAIEAVKIACHFDIYCYEPVHSIQFDEH